MKPDSPTKNLSDATAVLPAYVVQINSVKRLCHSMNHRGRHVGRPMVVWPEHKLLMWVGLCCSCTTSCNPYGQITKVLFEQESAQNTVVYCLLMSSLSMLYQPQLKAIPVQAARKQAAKSTAQTVPSTRRIPWRLRFYSVVR